MTLSNLTTNELNAIQQAIAANYNGPVHRLRAVTVAPSGELLAVFESDQGDRTHRLAITFGESPTLTPLAVIRRPAPSDYRAVIERVVKWQGLEIGLEFSPGAVRFPGSHAHKLKSGYGHLRKTFTNDDHKAADCYLSARLLHDPDTAPTTVFVIDQRHPETGAHDEYKWMLGYPTREAAIAAYVAEMPSLDWFGGIREADLSELRSPEFAETAAIAVAGEPLPDAEWDALAAITDEDIADALETMGEAEAIDLAENDAVLDYLEQVSWSEIPFTATLEAEFDLDALERSLEAVGEAEANFLDLAEDDAVLDYLEYCVWDDISFAKTLESEFDLEATMPATYAEIGLRAVELYQQHVDREEFREGLAAASMGTFYEFAAKKKASGTGKKKNCTPGKSHFCRKAGGEGTCLPMSKKCRQKIDDADSQAVDNYVKDKAGALAISGGGKLSGSARDEADSKTNSKGSKETTRDDSADRKFASDNPSLADVNGWIDAKVTEALSPEAMATERLVGAYLGTTKSLANLSQNRDDEAARVLGVRDRASFAKAAAAREREFYLSRPDGFTADDFDLGFTKNEIATIEKKLANPKTKATTKAKLQADLAKKKAKYAQEMQDNEAIAAKQNKKREDALANPDQRIKELEAEFDAEVEKQRGAAAERRKKFDAGDQKTREDVYRQIMTENEHYARVHRQLKDQNEGNTPQTQFNTDVYVHGDTSRPGASYRRLVREHLQQVATNSPEAKLKLGDDLSPAAIKAAYRKAAKQAHPDAGGNKEDFEKINQAYKALQRKYNFSDPDSDSEYSELDDFADF